MDGIVALGHFCETHGPCILLSTQRSQDEPQQQPHNLTIPICDACMSVDVMQALVSKDENASYVTTRTPLQQELAFLLKQAVVRTLSCEETNQDGGIMYFGDNERGHVISHCFTVQDSLARGFQRKYCILVFTRDKIHLLNCWPFITKHLKQISTGLQEKSVKVNNAEQIHRPQRAVRQAQGSPLSTGRSLGQLTGEPAIFAHIHLWFTWILSAETVVEKPCKAPEVPVDYFRLNLREVYKTLCQETFCKLAYCYLTGIKVVSKNPQIEPFFCQFLPKKFTLPKAGESCYLSQTNHITWDATLPQKLPTLLTLIENALKDDNLPEAALEAHIISLVMQWYNIACVICWAPNENNANLLKSLGVQKHDMPLLSYWIPQCRGCS